jgi:VanZ family protein
MLRTLSLFLLPARPPLARYGPAVLWAALIFISSSIPGDQYPRVEFRFADKWVHLLLYVPLGWLIARALIIEFAGKASVVRLSVLAGLAGVLYGALDEIHQLWVPRRQCSGADWAVDCVAVAIGVALWCLIMRKKLRAANSA